MTKAQFPSFIEISWTVIELFGSESLYNVMRVPEGIQDQNRSAEKRHAPVAIPTPETDAPFMYPLLSSKIQPLMSKQLGVSSQNVKSGPVTKNSTYSLSPDGPCEISFITIDWDWPFQKINEFMMMKKSLVLDIVNFKFKRVN